MNSKLKMLGLLALLSAAPALAAENVVCTVATSASAASTASPTSGTCTWPRGGLVLMQCDQDVYFNANTGAGTTTVTPATSGSQRVNFNTGNNLDPITIYLGPNDKDVSVLQVSAAGTCKFIVSPFRRKPH